MSTRQAARLLAVPLVVALVATAAAGTSRIRVHSGDTLSGIAAGHNTTVEELLRLNHLKNPDLIQVGQVLLIPAAAPAPVAKPKAEPTTKVVTYVVRAGDTVTRDRAPLRRDRVAASPRATTSAAAG